MRLSFAVFLLALLAACPPPPERDYVPEEGVSFVQAGPVNVGYFEEGTGPLVLMLHGFPDTPHTWDAIRPEVADAGFRVVTPFIKGYAPTDAPAEVSAYRTGALGETVLHLIDALGEDEAILIGHDWGASSAYAATLLDPDRVTKLVAFAVPHHGVETDPLFLWRARHFIYLAQDDAEEAFAQDDFAHIEQLYCRWSPQWEPPPSEFEPVKNAFEKRASLTGALNYYRALWEGDGLVDDFLADPVTVPTLAFAGLSDGVVTEAMWDQTPDFFTDKYELVKLSGGHWVHRENEAEVLDALLPFLSD